MSPEMCKFSDIVALQQKQVRDPLRMYPGPYPTLQKVLLTEAEATQNRGETMAPMGHAGEGAENLRSRSSLSSFGVRAAESAATRGPSTSPQNPANSISPISEAHQERMKLQAGLRQLLMSLNERLEPILRVEVEQSRDKVPTDMGRGLVGAMRIDNAELDASCSFIASIIARLEL